MPSETDRLGLLRHTLADQFRIQDYTDNWNALDASPGILITDSASRPTWGAANEGQFIFETDTKLLWLWNGTGWERVFPQGLIGRESITADISTASTTYVTALTALVTVAAGDRVHQVVVEGPGVYSTEGLTTLRIQRDGNTLNEWVHQGHQGATPDTRPRPLSFVTHDEGAVEGSRTYTLQYAATAEFGGTSTLVAGADTPLALTVVEV